MSGQPFRAALTEYLAVRRSLGFKLARDGLLLEQFVSFCEQAGVSRVTSELALAWVSAPPKASAGWLGMRLTVVRGFARWLQASDPATEVPPLGWLPPRRRTTPYLYSADDVAALLAAARRVRWPLSAATYETLIALLAVTGMRIGEAIRLDRSDLSPGEGLLTISDSKFGKSRQLLLHPGTVSALGCYLRRRGELSPAPGEPAVFVHPAGNRLNYEAVQQMFKGSPRPGRDPAPLGPLPADYPRAQALVRREHPHPLVSRGRRRAGPAAAAVHLAGSCGPEVDVLVPIGVTGAARARR
jgi:hypothetical protein